LSSTTLATALSEQMRRADVICGGEVLIADTVLGSPDASIS
jgi:hypothetical protein